jgi:putative pyrroloquinoline-quinone binding quinoprotein
VNTEERQLAEMLHRVTPEPPRRVTVEDIAYRVASESHGSGRSRERAPRPRRGFSFGGASRGGRRWAPALAALSVVAIAGATVGIATVANSHHGTAPTTGTPASSASVSSAPPSTAPPSSTAPAGTPLRIAGGMWGAELISRQSLLPDSLVSGDDSLYAVGGGQLYRIDPATGQVLRSAPFSPSVQDRPVVLGNRVWVVWSYRSGLAELHGYDAQTLAQVASVQVPAIGGVAGSAQGVLAAGPDGQLYVAAGDIVAAVSPGSGQVTHRTQLTGGQATSVAVAPEAGKLYVGIGSAGSARLVTYDLGSGVLSTSVRLPNGQAGNLVATAGGVWGTAGTGTGLQVWFYNGADVTAVSAAASGGAASIPSLSDGAMWIGGPNEFDCANPDTGQLRVSSRVPADHGAPQSFGGAAVLGGRAYSVYQDQAAHLSGLARLTPDPTCAG